MNTATAFDPRVFYPDIRTTFVPRSIKTELILGDARHKRLIEEFWFYSARLNRWCCIPKGFVYDQESVPLLRGTNPEAGAIHDYLCRFDSDPVVSKSEAAEIYREFQLYFDRLETRASRFWRYMNRAFDKVKRVVKTDVVHVAWGYHHKFGIEATYAQITGRQELTAEIIMIKTLGAIAPLKGAG